MYLWADGGVLIEKLLTTLITLTFHCHHPVKKTVWAMSWFLLSKLSPNLKNKVAWVVVFEEIINILGGLYITFTRMHYIDHPFYKNISLSVAFELNRKGLVREQVMMQYLRNWVGSL